jgi:hypothetical protein
METDMSKLNQKQNDNQNLTDCSFLEIFLTPVKKEHFTIFPYWLRDMEGVNGFDKQVYLSIKSYAWKYIFCYPSLPTLTEHLDCTAKTLRASIKRLINLNLLLVISRQSECKENVYFILDLETDINFLKKYIKIHKKEILNFVDNPKRYNDSREFLPAKQVNFTPYSREFLPPKYTNNTSIQNNNNVVVFNFLCLNCMTKLDSFECSCKSNAIIPCDYLKMNGHTLSMDFLTKLIKKHKLYYSSGFI